MLKVVWKNKISPYDVCRVAGESFAMKIINAYVNRRLHDDYARHVVAAYTYQIFMKPGATTEFALLINFDSDMNAYLPLAAPCKLASEDFPIPFSIVHGDIDWVKDIDQGASELLVNINKQKFGNESNYYLQPDSGHNLHIDNENANINIIINECLYCDEPEKKLPVLPVKEYKSFLNPKGVDPPVPFKNDDIFSD